VSPLTVHRRLKNKKTLHQPRRSKTNIKLSPANLDSDSFYYSRPKDESLIVESVNQSMVEKSPGVSLTMSSYQAQNQTQ
jgi:hypothetical protein